MALLQTYMPRSLSRVAEKTLQLSAGSMLDENMEKATVVYLCATCFRPTLMRSVLIKLLGVAQRNGHPVRAISVSEVEDHRCGECSAIPAGCGPQPPCCVLWPPPCGPSIQPEASSDGAGVQRLQKEGLARARSADRSDSAWLSTLGLCCTTGSRQGCHHAHGFVRWYIYESSLRDQLQ